ncbi:hypothetical protein ABEG18_06270 [Alsobacter sp. KACC 23698]|uniref:Uncharacterized protein n=1 Tax=Alsobacter sp. KACC 23698 TaxID=3149229 RepID=A0AAU7JJ16_9HYPH
MTVLFTMPDMRWTVVCQDNKDRWVWLYTFNSNGTVAWKDELNGMTGSGSWKLQGDQLVTTWKGSATTERWRMPIDTARWSGSCTMHGKFYSLSAVSRDVMDPVVPPSKFLTTKDEKDAFVARCNIAAGRLQQLQMLFMAFLGQIATSYSQAYEAHRGFLADLDRSMQIRNDLMVGFALAFLGGGLGGVVGATLKSAGDTDFMIDGIKDLAKFGVRGPGGVALRAPPSGRLPGLPDQFANALSTRAHTEMAAMAATINFWRETVSNGSEEVEKFDPVDTIVGALFISEPGVTVRLNSLPLIDVASLKNDFQRGFLVGWLETDAKNVTRIPTSRTEAHNKSILYGQNLGIANIQALVEKHIELFVD